MGTTIQESRLQSMTADVKKKFYSTDYEFTWDFKDKTVLAYWNGLKRSSRMGKRYLKSQLVTFKTGVLAHHPHHFQFFIDSSQFKADVKSYIGESSCLKLCHSKTKIKAVGVAMSKTGKDKDQAITVAEDIKWPKAGRGMRKMINSLKDGLHHMNSLPLALCHLCCLPCMCLIKCPPRVVIISDTDGLLNLNTSFWSTSSLWTSWVGNATKLVFKITVEYTDVVTDETNAEIFDKLLRPFDMVKLFASPSHSDIVIECQGVAIPAHKAVLSQRSTVLDRMFSSDMKEAGDGKLLIPNADPKVLKNLLHFMYTGKLSSTPVHTKDIIDLFTLSHQYLVQPIADLCERRLIKKIKSNNVSELYKLSDLVGSKDLNTACFEFFKKELFKNPEGTLKTITAKQPTLTVGLFQKLVPDKADNPLNSSLQEIADV